jgi:3-methylcrotonyl-CoA carboxylase alpha subunit
MNVTTIAPGIYLVDDGQKRWTVAIADAADGRWIALEGQVAFVERPRAGDTSNRTRRRTSAAPMAAPMPATVIRILVEPGQQVHAGDTVLVLEAMKMEMPIRAARDGRVTAIRCAAGDLVQPGVDLVELD